MTFAAALCCASPGFAGGHMGATGAMAGTAGVHSGSTMGASFGGNSPITALPRTGTHINPNGNVSSVGFQQGQHRFGQQLHQQAPGQRERERSRTNGSIRERERERANGVVEEQRQEQRTNAAGQTRTRTQQRRSGLISKISHLISKISP